MGFTQVCVRPRYTSGRLLDLRRVHLLITMGPMMWDERRCPISHMLYFITCVCLDPTQDLLERLIAPQLVRDIPCGLVMLGSTAVLYYRLVW